MHAYDDPNIPVELGASIFVQVNRILVNAAKEFNLSISAERSTAAGPTIPGPSLAVWDGQSLVVTQEGENGWWDIAKLLWKYGLAPIKTIRLMRSTTAKFFKMYDEPVFPFCSLTQAVSDVGLLDVTASTGEQYMLEHGITGSFAHDIVQASTRVNYAQNLKYIHGLEAMVCMATDGAMAIEGGNWKIFEQMIVAANATTLLATGVSSVEKQDSGAYSIRFQPTAEVGDTASKSQNFDAVILAGPYQYANLSISPEPERLPDKVPYVQLHVTLFASPHLLSPVFFGLPQTEPAPKVILTTLPPGEDAGEGAAGCGSPGFFSISLLDPVINPTTGNQEYLYKIFSPSPPNSTFLANLLGLEHPHHRSGTGITDEDITWMYRKVWNSYPYEFPRVTFDDLQLDENLWYTSGMESFISTMETSALMGKNVARLVVDQWRGKLANGSKGGGVR